MRYQNGDEYSGEWIDDIKHDTTGSAEYVWQNQDKYLGPFIDDKMHGDGLFTPANKAPYKVCYVMGKKVGVYDDAGKYTELEKAESSQDS